MSLTSFLYIGQTYFFFCFVEQKYTDRTSYHHLAMLRIYDASTSDFVILFNNKKGSSDFVWSFVQRYTNFILLIIGRLKQKTIDFVENPQKWDYWSNLLYIFFHFPGLNMDWKANNKKKMDRMS